MNKFFVTLGLSFCMVGSLLAQDSTRTLIKIPSIKTYGFYIAPEYQYGKLSNDFTSFTGGSIMMLLNNRFAVGFSSQQSSTAGYSPTNISPLYLSSSMRGLKLEYSFTPTKPIHITVPLFIGNATALTSASANAGNGGRGPRGVQSSFYIIQPGVEVEMNLIKYIRFYTGVNYRIASSRNSNNTLTSEVYNGLSVNAGIKIGLFEMKAGKK
jgi:hypothetical protein